MYKRRARVLFVEVPAAGLAQLAAAWAVPLAEEWIEARAATPPDMPSPAARAIMAELGLPPPARVDAHTDAFGWADLLVPLTEQAAALCEAPPAGVRVKHWIMVEPGAQDVDRWREVAEHLRARVAGMAGGMRMLAGTAPTSGARRTRRSPAEE